MRLTKIASIALLCITLVSTIACGSNPEQAAPGFTTYTENINGFSISIPDGWDSFQMDTLGVIFTCPHQCGEISAKGGVTVTDTGHSSVQDYYTEEIVQLFEIEDRNNLISKEDLTVEGIPAIKIVYTFDSPTYYGDMMNIENMECIFINQQGLWSIIMQCDSACWDTYKPTFDTMLDSFQLLD
ncbi:MAG: PsbP-related protein [Dehalococcoidia bacterium]